MSNPIDLAAQHIERAIEHHRAARASHRAAGEALNSIGSLVTRALQAHALGNDSATKARLQELKAAQEEAAEHHEDAAGDFGIALSAVHAAKRALAEVPTHGDPSDSTHSQTSGGLSLGTSDGRRLDAESIRFRDQLAACRHAMESI